MTAEEFLNQYDPSSKRSVSQEPASSVTSFLDQYDPSIKEPSGSSTEEPEPREFFSFEDAVSAIGTIPEALAVGVPAAYQKLVTGLEIPEKSEAIESELAFQQRIQTEQADRVASGKATTFGSAIREALPSLGFSVLPMAAAIPAGIGGTMAGGPAAPVTGPAAAMAASGTVAYRMAGSDMMYRAYKQLEEAKGSPLSNEEKAEYYKTVLPIAQNYGLWEAGPEAVSNAITMGVGKFVFGFGKQAAKKLVGESIDSANKTIARKVAEKGAAVAGGLGTEIASEGITSVGQYPEEARIRQLAATGEVSQGEPPSYPGGYMQAVKDVAPATIALYGMMGTAAGGAKLSTLPFRSQKTPEQIAEDNINLEADRVSRELSIGETDEETKSINAALQTARNNLIAKKEVYTALEPNDPAAQSLGLEIREMEREVVALDNELKKRVGEPLSEPITEAERQQAELAKAIVEEPAPTVKESLTVQPAPAPVEQAASTPPVLYHGGRKGMSTEDIQIVREPGATKQGKRGRVYGGFYTTEKLNEAEQYAAMLGEDNTVYEVQLNPSAVVETYAGDITRLSPQRIEEFRNRGVDIVVGKDVRGRTENVIINKEAVASFTDINKPPSAPVEQVVIPPVEVAPAPKTREQAVSELEKREAGKDRLQELTSAGEQIAEESQILDDILGIDPNSKESENLSNREKIARLTPEQRIEYGNRFSSLVSQRLTITPAQTIAEAAPKTPAPVTEPAAEAPAPEVAPVRKYSIDSPEVKQAVEQTTSVQFLNRKLARVESEASAAEEAYNVAQSNLQQSDKRMANYQDYVRSEKRAKSVRDSARKEVEKVRLELSEERARKAPFVRLELNSAVQEATATPTPAVSETITEPTAATPQIEQEIEVGDEASVNLAGRNETVTIARIEDINGVQTAYFDYFGYKSRPLAEMQLVKKSKQNIARAERKAKESRTSQTEITQPKPEDFFSNEEIASLASGKAPDGWKSDTYALDDFFLTDTNGKRWSFKPQYENGEITSIFMRAKGQVTGVTITKATAPTAQPTGIAVGNRVKLGKSPQTYTIEEVIPQSANDKKFGEQYYSVKNEKTGETQVVEKNDIKPVSSRRRKMASEPEPLPENERYGQVKLNQRIQRYFGGKIPDKVYVVDNTTNKEYQYKAAYYPDLGILVVNNAYVRKGENVGDIIAHELGHYAFGDKKFKAAFDNFYNSLSTEDKAKIDKIIEESYNKETEQSQIEERNVIAFTAYTIVNPQRRSLWNAVLDALKAFANKVFGKNFQLSDPNRTALAILSTAKRRFAAGEEIVREDTKAKRAAAQTQDARFAELEARARAGDKEAEAEAQRMVDEAAKAAGYDVKAIHGTPAKERIDVFGRRGELTGMRSAIKAFFFSDSKDVAKTYRFQNRENPNEDQINAWIDSLSDEDLFRIIPENWGISNEDSAWMRFSAKKEALNFTNEIGEDIYYAIDELINSAKENNIPYPSELDPDLIGQAIPVFLNINNPYKFTYDEFESDGIDAIVDRAIAGGFDGGISTEKIPDAFVGSDNKNPPSGIIKFVFNPNQIKSADPFTYDDAGNLIPLSERFQPSEPDIRRMAARREQIMGEKVGPEVKTPEGIIAKTQELLRKQFDPTKVSEKNTTEAFRAIGRLTSKQGNAFAEELNDLGRVEGSEVSMGAALFVNDLFEYSIRLAAEGQKMMLGVMMTNINKLPTGAMGATGAGQTLRARLELSQRFLTMAQAEQDAYTNYVAEFIYGPNPTKEQIQSIKDAYAKVDKTEPITEEELTDELEEVGKKTGTDLVGKINIQIEEATPPTQNPIVSTILTLQKLYGGTIETRYTEARESAQKIKEGVKKILTGGITNYRGKMVEGAASGLESGFWKTLSSKENKPGPLGELDAAQNRELGNIVKNMLISIGLKGTPPNTKMDIYEQVASILGEKQLSKDKIKLADEKIRGEINRKRAKEIEETEDSDAQDAINLKYDAIEHAWDEAMARQLDMPISGSMLRRLIFNELKEDKTSVADLAKLMNEEPVIGASRQDRLVNSIITKIAGVTFEGQNPADYSALKEYLGNQLEALILEKQTKGKAARAKEQLAKDAKGSVELQAEKAENEAQKQIERLAKIQSDTPSFPEEAKMNPVREAVKNALKLNLNKMFDPSQSAEIISKFKKSFVKELIGLGVKEAPANILADVVGRQIEINSLNNQLKSIDRAIEKGPISEIVKAIKDTPLEDQQKPNWRYEVMRDYLRKAGLPLAQAERIAKLMDISLQKRFTMAQEQAFTDAISKSAPWKSGDTRSRRAFQNVLQALRAGALDPARNVLSDMAALNGWTGFTPEQYKALLKNDAILSDPESADATKAEAHKAIQDIISKAKLPIRARDVIGQFYDAQALSGIPTMTVNIFSPAGMAVKNALTQSLNGLLTARPEQITAALTTFIDSIKSWANTVAFSFKNNVTVYSNVEYLVNDEGLLKLYKRGVDQFNKGKTPRERADGVKNMMIGMMDYVRRVLNALDYGAIAALQNQSVSKYALAAMQAKGMSSKDGAKMLNAMMEQKRIFYTQQIAIGTDKNKAAVLADEFFISAWEDALTKEGVEKSEIKKAMDAALNDAMSAVGRNRQSLDAFREEETNTRDEGLLSFPAIWLLETMANAANKQDNQFIKIFSRVIYGFAIVPARVLRETAWFSPVGAYRFAYDYIAKKKGLKSRYAQSLGNDLQYRQRLTETITGSIVMLAFAAAMSSSTEDEEDEKPFKIVVTGNGPLRSEDPQYYDSWTKKHKANTVSVYFGKTKFTINTMRGFEAFAWPAMMLGAVDDWHIRRKQGRTTNTPLQMQDAAIVAGNVLSASLRRGPYAFAAKPLFEAYGDRGVESLAKSLAFPAKTLVPVLGSSLAKNFSDFLNEPVDRKTLEGALWANVPFIGPAVSPKSLNAFGEPALANEAADKIFKLGVPIIFNIPTDRDSVNLHELVLKQGGGPSIPTRNQLAQRLDREPTNKEYEMFVKEYGAKISSDMKRRYEELSNKTPDKYSKSVEKIGNRARDIAERKVREAAKKP